MRRSRTRFGAGGPGRRGVSGSLFCYRADQRPGSGSGLTDPAGSRRGGGGGGAGTWGALRDRPSHHVLNAFVLHVEVT